MTKNLDKWRNLTIVRPIELGGMSDIYVVLSPNHERLVLKRLKEEFRGQRRMRKQFINGIEILSRLSHPSIIPFVEGGCDDDNVPYLLIAYFESKTLRQLMHAGDPLISSHLMMILIQLAEGIDYIHWTGYLHFDLKPENILIDQHGELRIIDFDLAIERKKKPVKIREISGTPAYLAPEVLRTRRVDESSDIYSFGVITYEILTRSKPPDPADANRISRMETQLLQAAVPPALARIVFKCLDPNPAARYPAMVLVLHELNKIL